MLGGKYERSRAIVCSVEQSKTVAMEKMIIRFVFAWGSAVGKFESILVAPWQSFDRKGCGVKLPTRYSGPSAREREPLYTEIRAMVETVWCADACLSG